MEIKKRESTQESVFEKTKREARARYKLKKQGYLLKKSRARMWEEYNQLGYRIVTKDTNEIEDGDEWDLSLDDVESFIAHGWRWRRYKVN